MKKTSVFLTILLVVSLIFAVSCPNKNPTAKITAPTGNAAAIPVTVGGEVATKEVVVELTDDTFNEDAFNVTAGNQTDLSGWFTSSDTTKATVSAKIKPNGLEEAAATKADEAKKYVKATIDLTVTPVAATAENTPVKVAFKIPAVTGEAKKWTASGKELTAENVIAITVNPKPLEVTASAKNVRSKYDTYTTGVVTTITLDGATFKNPTPALPKSVAFGDRFFLDECSYSRDERDLHKVSVTLKSSKVPSADNINKEVTISISADEVTLEEGYKLPENFSVVFNAAATSM